MTTKFDRALQKLEKDREKERRSLQAELDAAREQASSARRAQEEARGRIDGLETERPRTAASVFAGAAEEEDLDKIDGRIREQRRRIEIARMAEAEGLKRVAEAEERLKAADHESAEKRYDSYAKEREARIKDAEGALDELAEKLASLLDVVEGHERVMRELGQRRAGRPYTDVLEEFLITRLRHYFPNSLRPGVWFNKGVPSLLAVDFYTQTLAEGRAKNEAEMAKAAEQSAKQHASYEAMKRAEAFDGARRQIIATHGSTSPTARHELSMLEHQFSDIVAGEKQAKIDERRRELRTMLANGEDFDSLSEERRREIDSACDEWLEDEDRVN
jgi:hypothetical protein